MRSVRVSVDGIQWNLPYSTITAVDVVDFHRAVGRLTLRDALKPGAPLDIDVIAAFAWIALRRETPSLTFEQVAAEITFDAVGGIELIEDGDDG